MATEKKISLKFSTTSGRERSLNINAAPVNDSLVDPDTSQPLWTSATIDSIKAVWADDDGSTIAGDITALIITTTTTTVSAS